MDLRDSETERDFRGQLRAWLEKAVPAHGSPPPADDWTARRTYDTQWQRKLFDAGYAGVFWPAEFGGRGATLVQQLIYYEELARARAPHIGINFVGQQHAGPTLVAEGTPEQKARHLPRILKGEEIWCQGFSEPSAGSDLASLATRAVRDGDEYVINGHKIWTSYAQVAEYCELLVRTDPKAPKHKGISWLILPMASKGLEIRPLKTLAGETDFSEVYLEDVRVPAANRVGAENDGWRIANVTLRFERGTAFAGWIIELRALLSELVAVARKQNRWDDASLRGEVGKMAAEVDALWAMVRLSIGEAEATGVPGLGGSAIKVFYSELYQRVAELGMKLLGRAAWSWNDVSSLPSQSFLTKAMNSISLTIAAGTSQIQRNIIAERVLGLPKEPR
ncbi:MAG TPA: acyl-CoA dehydrogenase family protein [Myxococcaceae bacterium]|nr:acyl-CoA dehydrogenase family protein [Myxococcaceae bacterium]